MLEFIRLHMPWLAVAAIVIAGVLAIGGGWGRLALALVLVSLVVGAYWMFVTAF